MVSVRFVVTCLEADTCVVYFEPEGAWVTLKLGDKLTVEITGEDGGIPEISYLPSGVSIFAWSGP